jgi:hypothetical protein
VNSITDHLETKENLKHLKVVLEAPFNCWTTSDGHNSFFMQQVLGFFASLADASTHGGLSPTGLRLQRRARKLKLW